ncbi:hypothetical protein [Oscillibacter sp.]|uniref:hypothetical protein n=1 Tax=Oscillibacter sp. TaxID=1945593 RepID=UPI00289EE5BF|nr:hypothetical protein [Oscillibacter sp.]
MKKEVEEFLNRSRQEREESGRKAQKSFLLELGLYRVIPMPESGTAENYPDFDDSGERCRKEPLDVTDEEYAALCHEVEKKTKKDWPVWPVYQLLFVLAIVVWVAGLVMGFTIGGQIMGEYTGFSVMAALSTWITFAVYGAVLLALSEFVRLMKKRNGEL